MANFISKDNKRMLWNIMIETDLFAGIDDNKYSQVKTLFENVMNKIHLEEKPLNVKNKMVLSEMSVKLRLIKNSKAILTDEINPIYTSDYNLHIEDKPDTIEFTDTIVETSVNEKDLDRLIQSRTQIMNEVMSTMPEPPSIPEMNVLDFLNKPNQKRELFKDIKQTCDQLSDGFKKLGILLEKMETIINV